MLAAIENLDPAHWHDILLDGPQRPQQIEKVKTIIRRMGEAGIPVLGYNFSLAGVCGRVTAPLGTRTRRHRRDGWPCRRCSHSERNGLEHGLRSVARLPARCRPFLMKSYGAGCKDFWQR